MIYLNKLLQDNVVAGMFDDHNSDGHATDIASNGIELIKTAVSAWLISSAKDYAQQTILLTEHFCYL